MLRGRGPQYKLHMTTPTGCVKAEPTVRENCVLAGAGATTPTMPTADVFLGQPMQASVPVCGSFRLSHRNVHSTLAESNIVQHAGQMCSRCQLVSGSWQLVK